MLLMLDIYFALVLFHLAFGANIPKIPDSPPSPYLQELAGQPQVECTSSIDWKGDGYNNEDCRAAVQQLYNVEVFKHQGANFEFLAKGASPKTSHSTMTTPRRYTYGKGSSTKF